MKIKTLRKIRLLLGILSVAGASIVVYTVNNNMDTNNANAILVVAITILLMCIIGIIVSYKIRWKEIEEGLI